MRRFLLTTSALVSLSGAAMAQTVDLNLGSITEDGTSNSWMLGFPYGGGSQFTLPSNGEGETYSMSSISSSGGNLVLTAAPNTDTSQAWPQNMPFTSGAISSASLANGEPQAGGFTFTYGEFSMTAELPNYVPGMWPAFWAMPVDGNTACEIDVMEAIGTDPDNEYHASLHDGGTGYTQNVTGSANLAAGFNTFSVDWEPNTITWLLNGQQVAQVATPASCNTAHYILANVAVGGQSWAWPGAAAPGTTGSMTISSISYTPGANGTSSGGLAGGTTTTPIASAAPSPLLAASTAATAATPAAASASPSETTTPGGDDPTDCAGNHWAINAAGQVTENGALVPGGGDTSELSVVGCTVYGKDNGASGHNSPNPGGWFTLSGNPGAQNWTASAAPPSDGSTPNVVTAATVTPAAPTSAVQDYAGGVCTTAVPNYAASVGGFGTINGQILQPNGTPFIAHGVNVADFDMAQAENSLLSLLPGTNFVRLNIYSYAAPATYQSFINWATSHGVVVEIDDHTDFPSDAFSGAHLTAQTQFYGAMASAYKTNPYVWYESQNEPQGGDVAAEQEAVYNAVRDAGNNNPVGFNPLGGGDPGFQSTMDASFIASTSNTYIAVHNYAWLANEHFGGDVTAALNSQIAAAQSFSSQDGTEPVLIDEYGNSTDGETVDSDGAAVVAAVNASGYGSAAWSFMNPGGGSADQVTNNGQSLTAMGQQIAGAMPATAGCAQSPLPTGQTAPPLASASTDDTAPTLPPNPLSIDQVAQMAAAGP